MALGQLAMFGSLGLGVVGAATATDVVSLRELAHAANLPLISNGVIAVRQLMPDSVAHTAEPMAAVVGLVALAWIVASRLRVARLGFAATSA
jgi:hypothetical protein